MNGREEYLLSRHHQGVLCGRSNVGDVVKCGNRKDGRRRQKQVNSTREMVGNIGYLFGCLLLWSSTVISAWP